MLERAAMAASKWEAHRGERMVSVVVGAAQAARCNGALESRCSCLELAVARRRRYERRQEWRAQRGREENIGRGG